MSTKQKRKAASLDEAEPTPEQKKKGAEVLARLMSSIQKVDTQAPDAQTNETSMDDNNGGRIIYVLKDDDLLVVKGKQVIIVSNKKKNLELGKTSMEKKAPPKRSLRRNLKKRKDSRMR